MQPGPPRLHPGRNQPVRKPNEGVVRFTFRPTASLNPTRLVSSPSCEKFLHEAIDMAVQNVTSGQGGPFAALVVQNDTVLGRGTNVVTTINDPTAHAEITAIRRACDALDDYELTGCTLYATCEPCPMCLGAAYWARLDRVYYAATREDAAAAGFDDDHIYEELNKPPADRRIPMKQKLQDEAERPFDAWLDYEEREEY